MAIEIVDFPMKNGDFPLLCEFTRGYVYLLEHPTFFNDLGGTPHDLGFFFFLGEHQYMGI